MNRFILLYDCPLRKCDKIWLYNGLRKYRETKVVSTLSPKSYFEISRFMPKIKIGKIIRTILVCVQAFRAVIVSGRGDIIVTWSRDQGCVVGTLCRILKRKRKIVSFNWLGLPSRTTKLIKRCFNDEDFMPIVNNISLRSAFMSFFELKKWNGVFLPDVFDNSEPFCAVEYRKQDKYVFAGGINNRDWNTLFKSIEKTPDIKYIIVSNRGDIDNDASAKFPNVIVKENLSAPEYYSLMKKAFVVVCPLKENRTSGLINILKSAQFGIPCISTNLEVTSIYYSQKNKLNLLFKRNDAADLRKKILKIYDLDEKTYLEMTADFQNYIKVEFDPKNNVEKLIEELKRREWV